MNITIISSLYSADKGCFENKQLQDFCQEYDVINYQGHLSSYEGIPMWTVLLSYRNKRNRYHDRPIQRNTQSSDPYYKLSAEERPLYTLLRDWRNKQAEQEGKPPFAIIRNAQLADIVSKLPKTKKDLRSIDGVGEATCTKYADAILALVKNNANANEK